MSSSPPKTASPPTAKPTACLAQLRFPLKSGLALIQIPDQILFFKDILSQLFSSPS